jgi:hypothetical protein
MKLTPMASHKTAKKPKGPLRTFNEIASEFNLHPSVLRHIMGTANVRPPQPFSNYKCATSEKTYYELSAMRAWWREYRALKESA